MKLIFKIHNFHNHQIITFQDTKIWDKLKYNIIQAILTNFYNIKKVISKNST